MRAAFPYMGDIRLVLEPIMRELGATVIIPPPPNRETVALGAQLAPETFCLPFKITLGNIVRALEMGADTLIYTTGSWSCRYGYYGRLQAEIARDLGYKFRLLELRHDRLMAVVKEIVALSDGRFSRAFLRVARAFRLGWFKASVLEKTYDYARRTMPFSLEPRDCRQLVHEIVNQIAYTDNVQELIRIRNSIANRFAQIRRNNRDGCLRIKLIGESYCTIEPFVNFNIIELLGEMGVWVEPFLTGPRWLGFHGFRLWKKEVIRAQMRAKKYWCYCVGGEDTNSLGHLILAAQEGYDGVIHIHPFACMPSTVIQPTLFLASRDYGIPLLSISVDEHTAETGFVSRVEAFVSVLERKRMMKGRRNDVSDNGKQ